MKRTKLKKKIRLSLCAACLLTAVSLIGIPTLVIGQATKEVRGTVLDSVDNTTLEGVTVMVKSTNKSVTTNSQGRYVIEVSSDDVLVFAFLGYETREIVVGDVPVVDVHLIRSLSNLEEVVVIGYGTQKKATITGSIATVDGNTLMESPAMSVTNSLAGRLPGLIATNPSSEPGGDGSNLLVRGQNTLGNNSPLIVVDGIILSSSVHNIDQSDIESITILKDASAAIYGAQAANGVILITTKRGATGKLKINYTHDQGWSAPTVIPKLADAATYAQLMNEIDMYRNRNPRFDGEEIQKFRDGSDPWRYANTDWYRETFRTAAPQSYDNISLSGGGESINYFVSAGYKFQDAIYKNSATNYSQFNYRSNIDGKISDYIKIGLDVSAQQENNNFPTSSAAAIIDGIIKSRPWDPAYWPNGLIGPDHEYGINPVAVTTDMTGYTRHRGFNIQTNARLDVKVPWVEGLAFTGNAAFFKRFYNLKQWIKPWYLYIWDRQSFDENNEPLLVRTQKGPADPRLTQSTTNTQSMTLNFMMNYERNIGENHYLKALVGTERIVGEDATFSAFRRYFISTDIDQMFAGGHLEKDNNGSANQNARQNYFGRVNYAFLQKYLLEFVWRVDGSYIFPEAHRFGFFPGVSVGWQLGEEGFWKRNLPSINHFKLRASWGQTGNDRITPYQFMSSYGFAAPYIYDAEIEAETLRELRVPNINVTWEVANQSNIGFDSEMLNGKILFSFDYFHNIRNNILTLRNASVPASTGLSLPPENIGKVSNRGIEFQLGFNNQIKSFNYSVSLNGGYAKNRIEFWDEAPGVPEYQRTTGYPMGAGLYYNVLGVFRDQDHLDSYPHWGGARPGDLIFEDVNGDGLINGQDMVRYRRNNVPRFMGGMNLAFGYKNFSASLLIQGATGAVQVHHTPSGDGWGNYLAQDAEGRWTSENTDASKPRIWSRADEYWAIDNGTNNTYFLRNNDYVRLKNVNLSYSLPESIIGKIGVNRLRVYLSGMNLLTFANLKDSDPEADRFWGAYPVNKVYNVGVNLNF